MSDEDRGHLPEDCVDDEKECRCPRCRAAAGEDYDGGKTWEYLSTRLVERLADLERDDLLALVLHGSGVDGDDGKLPGHLERVASHCKAVNTCALIMELVNAEMPVPMEMVFNLSAMSADAGINLQELQFYAANDDMPERVQ